MPGMSTRWGSELSGLAGIAIYFFVEARDSKGGGEQRGGEQRGGEQRGDEYKTAPILNNTGPYDKGAQFGISNISIYDAKASKGRESTISPSNNPIFPHNINKLS